MSLFLDWLAGSQWLNAHPTCHLLARFLVWFLCILQGLGVIFILDWFSSISRKNNNTEEFLQNFIVWLTILCLSLIDHHDYRQKNTILKNDRKWKETGLVESDSSIVVGWLSHGNMLTSSSLFQLSLSSSFMLCVSFGREWGSVEGAAMERIWYGCIYCF